MHSCGKNVAISLLVSVVGTENVSNDVIIEDTDSVSAEISNRERTGSEKDIFREGRRGRRRREEIREKEEGRGEKGGLEGKKRGYKY